MSCSAMRWGPGGSFGREAGRGGWRPFELAAMIGGFILFWPIGLAILAAKGWREGWWGPNRRNGEQGGPRMPWQGMGDWCGPRSNRGPEGDWRRELHRDSGNVVFEDYKAAELKRLQEEYERLAADQRAFGEHIEALRRAKDKAEFDSFMAARRHGGTPGGGAQGAGPQGSDPQGPGESPAL